MASAELQVPDKQGRISIPTHLRGYARLERDLVVIGNNNKVEIWSAQLWDANQAEQDELFANRDEEVIPGIF
jgi:MraZ protein